MKPYYEDDAVTLYHGDCYEVMPELAPASLVLTDPPYGIGARYGAAYDDEREDYWGWLNARVEQMKLAAPVVVLTHRVAALKYLTGWDHVGVWAKPMSAGTRLGNSPIVPHWEPVILYGIHSLGVKTDMVRDIFEFPVEHIADHRGVRGREGWAKADAIQHPTPKPLPLLRRLIVSFSIADAVVVDPFAGGGTTLRAAKDLGRRAIGIEIEERFCELAARRCSQEVLPLGDVA